MEATIGEGSPGFCPSVADILSRHAKCIKNVLNCSSARYLTFVFVNVMFSFSFCIYTVKTFYILDTFSFTSYTVQNISLFMKYTYETHNHIHIKLVNLDKYGQSLRGIY